MFRSRREYELIHSSEASAPSAKMPTTKRRAGARQPWRISTPASLDDADSSDGELSPRVRPVDSAIDEQDDSSSYRRCPVRAAARPRRRTSSSFSSPPDGSPSPEAVHVPRAHLLEIFFAADLVRHKYSPTLMRSKELAAPYLFLTLGERRWKQRTSSRNDRIAHQIGSRFSERARGHWTMSNKVSSTKSRHYTPFDCFRDCSSYCRT